MKKISLLFVLVISVSSVIFLGNGSGAPSGRAGDPAGGNSNCTHCHAGPTPQTIPGLIYSNIPVSGYVPGQTYTITAEIVAFGHSKFGFQISPQTNTGTFMGTLVNTSAQTQLVGANKYITHTSMGTSGTNVKIWTFDWIAPISGSGQVTFYGAFNVANNNNASSGDTIYLSTLVVNENTTTAVTENKQDFLCTVYPNPVSVDSRLDISLKESKALNISLFDINGKLLYGKPLHVNNGFTSLPMPMLHELPSGTYFINISDNTAINQTLKIIRL